MAAIDTAKATNKSARIGIVAGCFAVYLFLTWFQTSQQNIGTVMAFATILLVIFSVCLAGQVRLSRFRLTGSSVSIAILLFLVILSSYYYENVQGQLKLIAQVILFLVVANVNFDEKERSFVKKSFIFSSTVFAILIIIGCTFLGADRDYHGHIVIFGTPLNPNHVGIPLVAVSCLLYYSFLHNKKRLFSLICLFVNVVAIFFTASKGNYLSLVVTFLFITVHWLSDRDLSLWRKILLMVAIIAILVAGATLLREYLPMQWERMTNISVEDDNGREELWRYAIAGFKEKPIIGHGIGSMYRNYGKATHNTFLEMFYELGLIGGILYIIFFGSLLLKSFKNKDKTLFFILMAIGLKMFFMSSIDDRSVWGIFCWAVIVSKPFAKVGYQPGVSE